MKIPELIRDMDEAVAKDKQGELELGWRIRLWLAMKDKFGEKESDFRRNTLAVLVARDTYPVWEQGQLVEAKPSDQMEVYYAYPAQALEEYKRYLLGKSSKDKVTAIAMEMNECYGYWSAKPDTAMQFAFVAIVVTAQRLESFDDELYEEEGWFQAVRDGQHLEIYDALLGEREYCEVHIFAADLAAELAKKKVDGRREFWRTWLADSVPSVLAPMAKVKALI